jgi:murein L,D-transpeptidase YcbB/YkuD
MTTRTTIKASRLLSVAAVALLASFPAYAATGGKAMMDEGMHGTPSATAKAPKMSGQKMAGQEGSEWNMSAPMMAGSKMAPSMSAKEVEMSAMPKAQLPRRAQVRGVQTALKAKGYGLTVDGILGKQTRAALRKFQKANGLKATGRIDKATLRSLNIS